MYDKWYNKAYAQRAFFSKFRTNLQQALRSFYQFKLNELDYFIAYLKEGCYTWTFSKRTQIRTHPNEYILNSTKKAQKTRE